MHRVRRARRRFATAWWSWHFQRRCTTVMEGLEVLGPCELSMMGGVVTVGRGLVIRSRWSNRVEISVSRTGTLHFGNNVFVNQGVRIACTRSIEIGDNCMIGDEAVILDSDYHSIGDQAAQSAPIKIEANVWLATRVIVLRGVTIGSGSVIGAGSVVTRSIPPSTFAAGVPARPLRSLASR